MKPNSLYAQLELIQEPLEDAAQTDYSVARVWAVVKRRLRPLGSALLSYLCGSTDLRVTVQHSGHPSAWGDGKTLFVVYDPVSQQRHTFSSEQELRVWIDQRYYR
ncbi:hypothetical protein PGN35_001460 [Nodosilinea sp. PGN35]|uniref:hypothetical protein n=1 Tax=Nodosilinea sp. PGN35 TaxID=3020489 RepID=UPI0023B2A58F|nr:hypothetical protein [Nodosilinea sp. TSF1-S3]MDF0368926.1 hypothetical protein [Nodosilinea sp. TSF1-S3]